MAGYTRQSAADIIPGAEVTAAPLNAEFNQLQSAMHGSTGHNHQGGSGNGPQLSLTAAVTGVLPVANGGTNASTAAAARTSLFGVSTTVDNTLPRFDGITGSLQTSGIVVSDTNAVSGIVGLTVTGGGSLTGTWTDLGTVTTVDINGGTIDIPDTNFTLLGSSDATKKVQFQVDDLTTATTRTVTIPDANFTVVGTDTTQTLTNKSIVATQLTGTVASARISGSYTGITGVGALTAGSLSSTFGNISIGSSTITTTGAVSVGSLAASIASAVPITLTRTGSTINAGIQYTNDSGSVFAGHGSANTFSVGGSANLASGPWLTVTSTEAAAAEMLKAQNLTLTAVSAGGIGNITQDTSDGSDTKAIGIGGGGAVSNARGARILMYGNEHGSFPGLLSLSSGAGVGTIQLLTATELSSTLSVTGTTTLGTLSAGTSTLGSTTVSGLTSSASISATGGTFTSAVTASRFSTSSTGSTTTVAYSFGSDTNTGLYFPSENVMGVVTGGSVAARFNLSDIELLVATAVTGTFSSSGAATLERVVSTSGVFAQDASGDMFFRPAGPSSTTNQMTLSSSGNLTVTGTITASSDARFKTDIETITSGLEKINKLRGTSFAFTKDGKKTIGLIAQEVREVLPELVLEDESGYLSVAYGNIVAVLIEAVKELTEKVEKLEKEVK